MVYWLGYTASHPGSSGSISGIGINFLASKDILYNLRFYFDEASHDDVQNSA